MYANVIIQYGVKSLDHTFTYHIPDNLKEVVEVGKKVTVPFGKQTCNGFVISITNESNYDEVKDIIGVVNENLKLNDELMSLGKYLSELTLCTLVSAYQTMLPTSYKISNSKESYQKYNTYYELNDIDDNYINTIKKGSKKEEVLNLLKTGKKLKSELNNYGLKCLIEDNVVHEVKEEIYRLENKEVIEKPLTLNEEQQSSYNEIINNINTSNVYLLHGVTGSGKTEVYMHLIDYVIKQGKTAIMLVPEISLTTQIVSRFYNRFGSDVAIFHSSLSDGEKFDEYNKIKEGKVHVVVGTRSAIFTQLDNLGLIIIDEEHSSNYKQENNPRYHVLDIAKWRSNYHNCPIILGSATPSLESMARANKGVYKLLTLKSRPKGSNLPNIKLVNMQDEFKKRNMILSDELKLNIMQTLERNEQVMLLINRRGFSNITTCEACGYTYKCPYCDISLTYHKTSNHLRCHYCGYTKLYTDKCPECGESTIRDYGLGTEKVEKIVKELYPSYKVLRMDADTTTKKGSHDLYIKQIENHEYDIIIGTQMISKGLDFPKVTLVGVINADESLNIPDFRSGENTYSLLSQVSGRAGRGKYPGTVIIQTFNPDSKTLNYVLNNDYIGNYNYEMDIRRKLKYPPYYYLINIKILSKKYNNCIIYIKI